MERSSVVSTGTEMGNWYVVIYLFFRGDSRGIGRNGGFDKLRDDNEPTGSERDGVFGESGVGNDDDA